MKKLRVDISRKKIPTRMIKGVQVFEDSGYNYVDAFFPDGSQRTVGYVGRNHPEHPFIPTFRMPKALMEQIQEEINKINGMDVEPPFPLNDLGEKCDD